MNNFFDNQRILNIIWSRKTHFMIIGAIAIVLSVFFSSKTFIEPRYKSSARIYPINLFPFSDESETEQMLEIINSEDIKRRMFDAFDLDKVYHISKDDPHYMTYMMHRYNTNVGASKTEFETVEIKVLDTNPVRACNMCDSIIHFYNQKVRDMHAVKSWEMVKITKDGLNEKQTQLDSILERLKGIRGEYGILNYNSQVKEVTKGYMEALAANKVSTVGTQKIKALYDNLVKEGDETNLLEVRFRQLVSVIDSLTLEHEFYLQEAQKEITYCHIVEYPVPADKKSYPVRWLIVLISVLSTTFIALLVFLILDYKKEK
ncbi:hypothetical protein MNBD_BACTEROID01-1572 [hydrothermal vent metagenome]|uniref:Polysaccharide chain length determinant N-terminal domain-containing protein n=1 Tax=hydrothermal vent metagenome TaxID=652676 RepID=A0A3B0TQH9_9ZZZZ